MDVSLQVELAFLTDRPLGIVIIACLTDLSILFNTRVIKMSSPHFNSITAFGCFLCYTHVLLATFGNSIVYVGKSRTICQVGSYNLCYQQLHCSYSFGHGYRPRIAYASKLQVFDNVKHIPLDFFSFLGLHLIWSLPCLRECA